LLISLASFGNCFRALFEGVVHLFEPTQSVIQAASEQGNEQAPERFSLDEPNPVLSQRLDDEAVLTVE